MIPDFYEAWRTERLADSRRCNFLLPQDPERRTTMIPDFYEAWRQETDRQMILDRQEAERRQKRELIDDIIRYVGIPLLVAAVLAAPTVMQAVFG